jgi:hypothetical protein
MPLRTAAVSAADTADTTSGVFTKAARNETDSQVSPPLPHMYSAVV